MGITTVYTVLAPMYDRVRPWWIAVMAKEAEQFLESEILPRYLTPHTRILDLGCGTGANLERLLRLGLPFGTYTGLDLTPAMLARARLKESALPKRHVRNRVRGNGCGERVRLLRGDMRHLPFPDGSFDFVLSTWAVEHVHPAKQVVGEGLRVLKAGGHMALLCHCCPPGPWRRVLRLTEGLLLMHCPEPDDLKSDAQILSQYFLGGFETLVLFRKPGNETVGGETIQRIEAVVQAVPGVRKVVNHLEVLQHADDPRGRTNSPTPGRGPGAGAESGGSGHGAGCSRRGRPGGSDPGPHHSGLPAERPAGR